MSVKRVVCKKATEVRGRNDRVVSTAVVFDLAMGVVSWLGSYAAQS